MGHIITMVEKTVRKTTTKKTAARKTAVKKTAVKKTAAKKSMTTSTKPRAKTAQAATSGSGSSRRAPTKIPRAQSRWTQRRYIQMAAFAFFFTTLGISVAIGYSGSGQISVAGGVHYTATVQDSAANTNGTNALPVRQSHPARVNGGLVPSSNQTAKKAPAQKPTPEAATTTATTTVGAAASTTEPTSPATSTTAS